jgi:hypothetical protein
VMAMGGGFGVAPAARAQGFGGPSTSHIRRPDHRPPFRTQPYPYPRGKWGYGPGSGYWGGGWGNRGGWWYDQRGRGGFGGGRGRGHGRPGFPGRWY